MGAVEPKAGDAICHIGAGTGYYSAILSILALPGGTVKAFEIDENLARRARDNLEPFENVEVIQGDATRLPLPLSDLIYVNAGVVTPPVGWLTALRTGGRMIFPSRLHAGFSVKPLMASYFIPCAGAADAAECLKIPDQREAWSARSVWLSSDREPDETAVAICEDMWFSSAELPVDA
jgi:protein-L-isoaspartate(D-aspartate) O-methyltransferase